MVEPHHLLVVEACAGLATVREIEFQHKLVEAHKLHVIAGVPAKQSKEVDYSLGKIIGLAVARRDCTRCRVFPFEGEYRESQTVAVALAELAVTLGLQKKRQMGKGGHCILPAEGSVEKHVQGSRRQPLLAADNVRDLHQMVVHDVRKVVGGKLVGRFIKHLIVEDRRVDGYRAADNVVNDNLFARLNLEAHHIFVAAVDKLLHLFGRHRERVAHHHTGRCIVLEILNLGTFLVELLGGVESNIGLSAVKQNLNIFFINFPSLGLSVGTILAAEGDTLVELYAEPSERFEYILLGTLDETVGIGIFETENKISTMLFGKQIIIQRSSYAANVQRACGAGCEAHSYSSVIHKLYTNFILTFVPLCRHVNFVSFME